jgi:hypothetical protein
MRARLRFTPLKKLSFLFRKLSFSLKKVRTHLRSRLRFTPPKKLSFFYQKLSFWSNNLSGLEYEQIFFIVNDCFNPPIEVSQLPCWRKSVQPEIYHLQPLLAGWGWPADHQASLKPE